VAYRLRVRTFLLPIFVISLVFPGFQTSAQTSSSYRKQAIFTLLESEHVASVSFAQIVGGKTTLAEAYGEQSPGVATSTFTSYNIASMSKPISAEVLLRLASKGRLSLDEPMYKYWVDPDVADDPRAKLLTPRMALDHQTGFANWRRETNGKLAFTRDPGKAFGYSGEGYQYVARFAEKKTGEPFESLAQTLIFNPAGMTHTAYTHRPWIWTATSRNPPIKMASG
jgi:CubicO group peptidase (beta-lactamase class C family)